MPTLKKLICSVEWTDSGIPLQEHNTSYVDGFVKTYIAVPSKPTPFSIRLRSNGYISPGLAMFVYMDGVYQCNRNRQNLKIPDGTSARKQTEVNLHVRQKEEMMRDGTFRAKQWRFQNLNVSDSSELENIHVLHDPEFVGTIEVVVLRCTEASNSNVSQHQITGSRFPAQALNSNKFKRFYPQSSDDDSWSSSSSASVIGGMFDGACDYATKPTGSMAFGGDMAWDDLSPNQDQPQQWRSGSKDSHSGARNRSQDQIGQDWGPTRSENKRSHNSSTPQANADKNSSSAKSKTLSSIVSRHSPAGSAPNRNGPNVSATADAPAVVININRGPRPRREPTWTEASEVESVNENVPWHNVGQGEKNSQSQRGERRSPNGSVEHDGSKKSDSGGGNWQAQPAYGGNGGDRGYSRPENWETVQPAMPGGWDASNDQPQANYTGWDNNQSNNSATWKATNEQAQDNDNNWNTNENHDNGWGVQENNDVENWEDSNNQGQGNDNEWNAKANESTPGWGSSAQQNQGQHQQWNSNENNDTAQNNWVGDGGWSDGGRNQQNGNSPSNNHDLAAQSWGGKDENNNWAEPTQPKAGTTGAAPGFGNAQSKSRFSGGGTREKSSSPFSFMKDPNQVGKPSSPHPSRKQSSPQAAWVESGVTVPGMAPQQSSPHLVTHDGANAPQMGSLPSGVPGLPQSDAFQPKPYWSYWKQPTDNDIGPNPFVPAFASVEPLCKVPSEVAQRNNTTHQVHVGQSIPYAHRKASPKYLDSHDDPYAVFVFQYRSRAILEQMLKTKLTETEAEGRLRMQGMSKDELIEKILKVKANSTSQGSSGSESASASNQSGGNNTAYDPNRHAADGGNAGVVNPPHSNLPMHGNDGSNRGSTHSDVRRGRDTQGVQNNTPSWDRVPTASNHDRVAGWLGSDNGIGGGGAGGAGVQNGGSRHGGAGWTGTGAGNGTPSESFGGNVNHDGNGGNMNANTQAGGNGTWNGTANWTGQQEEGRGNGNGNWNYDNNVNVGSGGGQATGSWQGDGGGGGGGGGETASKW